MILIHSSFLCGTSTAQSGNLMVLFMSEGKMGHEINRQTYTFELYLSDCHGEEETEPEALIYQSIRFLQMDQPIRLLSLKKSSVRVCTIFGLHPSWGCKLFYKGSILCH